MSEAGFLLFQRILSAVQICLYAVFLAVFFLPFFPGKRKGKIAAAFLIFALVYFIKVMAPVSSWLCMILILALLIVFSGYFGMDRKFTLFLGVLYFSVRNLCILSMQSINFFTSRQFVREGDEVEIIFRNAVLNCVIVEVIQICQFSLLLYIVYRQLRGVRGSSTQRNCVFFFFRL